MCVILIAEDKKPSRALLAAAARANGHGMGVGWVERKGTVCWEKGLDLKALEKIVDRVRLPLVVHFRIASVGGVSKELCHPFPVIAEANALSGRLKSGALLFHNGHWGEWKELLLRSLTGDGTSQLPTGVWSDSRAMALLAHRHGLGVLGLIEARQRIVTLTKDGARRYGDGWVKADGVWLSNTVGLGGVADLPVVTDWRAQTPRLNFGGSAAGTKRPAATGWGGAPRLTEEAESISRAIDSGHLFEYDQSCDLTDAAEEGAQPACEGCGAETVPLRRFGDSMICDGCYDEFFSDATGRRDEPAKGPRRKRVEVRGA